MSARTSVRLRSRPGRSRGSETRRSMSANAPEEYGGRREGDQRPGPVVGIADVHHGVDERDHAGRDRDRAGQVEAPREAYRRLVAPDQQVPRDQDDQPQDHRREEHPAPVHLGEQPAHHESQRETGGPGRAVDHQRPVALVASSEAGGDDAEPGGGHERGGDARGETGQDQHPPFLREAADTREHDEHGQAREEHPAPAEHVGAAPAEQHEPAVAQHVGADHPLRGAGREAELRADRGHRDVQHGDVDALEEDRAAHHQQQGPRAAAESRVGRLVTRLQL